MWLAALGSVAVAEEGKGVVRSSTTVRVVPQGLVCVRGGWFLKAAFSWGHETPQQPLSMKLSFII